MKFILPTLLLSFLLFSCQKTTSKKYLLQELNSDQTGIHFENKLNDTPKLNILTYLYYYNGAGVAAGDFNNDGLIDLYFIGNQVSNKFFINQGNFKFKDATLQANLKGQQGWSSGVTVADVNGDGWLDIYVCQVADKKWFDGANQLFINQGVNKNGIPVFKDEAKQYGLAVSSYSNQATFFDYDLDGDLDLFLMKNQSVHPSATFGRFKRHINDAPAGDKLFKNDNGHFTEVTQQAGIFSSLTGYGLGLAISDFNQDGWPDIYVGNDFFENDYLYINQKNGTFSEQISKGFTKLGHTTHFSMGNDVADFNNDGFTDILSVDMLPENRSTYTASGTEYEYEHYNRFLKNGYAPQYMHNTLHLNLKNGNFSEIGFYAGITATEWSWAPLFADFDNDGLKDIFISNGIYGATNNMDFINFISTKDNQRLINKGMTHDDMGLIKKIPKISTPNYIFKNTGNLGFKKMNGKWLTTKSTFSNGAIYADLDNDGDLDLVVNNLNEPSTIFKNTSKNKTYLKIRFHGLSKNTKGIGAKVICYNNGKLQYAENFTTRGYLSSVAPELHFGFDSIKQIDSLKVIWPNQDTQLIKNIKTNQTLILNAKNAKSIILKKNIDTKGYLTNVNSKIKYKNSDFPSYGFAREPLIPFMQSNLGPHLDVADIDKNGYDDVFIGGAKQKKANLFLQDSLGNFILSSQPDLDKDYHKEDADNIFVDVDNDGDLDLVVVSGGDEFMSGPNLKPRLYLNDKGQFIKQKDAFKTIFVNASVVKVTDFDNDGFQDLFIGSNSKPQHYGIIPKSYLLKNDGHNHFIDVTNTSAKILLNMGMVQDATWQDINNDGFKDLILVGHWMPITILINHNGKFSKQKNNGLKYTNGLWNCIAKADFDKDGDMDFVIGNWGENTLLKASVKNPVNLYVGDFDNNGKSAPIITYYHKNKEILLPTHDALFRQIPSLNNKFKTYTDFSKVNFNEIFDKKNLEKALKYHIYNLSSSYVENLGNGKFKIKPLPYMTQWSNIQTLLVDDFNNDGYPDVLTAGNLYEVNTQFGRLDASHGILLLNDKKGNFKTSIDINKSFNISGPARSIKKIKINKSSYYIIGINNDSLQMLKKITTLN